MTPWTNCSLCIPVCTGRLAEEHEGTPHRGGIRSVLRRSISAAETCFTNASPRLAGPIGTRSSRQPGSVDFSWAKLATILLGASLCCSPETPIWVLFACGPRSEFAVTIEFPHPVKVGQLGQGPLFVPHAETSLSFLEPEEFGLLTMIQFKVSHSLNLTAEDERDRAVSSKVLYVSMMEKKRRGQ